MRRVDGGNLFPEQAKFQYTWMEADSVKDPLPSDSESNSDDSVCSYRIMAQRRTLKELLALGLDQQPLCIQYQPLDVNFELKSGLIHLLPSFHGLAGEDPNKHWNEFHIVYSSMKPAAVTEEQIKLRAFPFSQKDAAKDWLYYLPPSTVETWNGMKTMFLERYSPASKLWKNQERDLRSMIDAASGGALVDMTHAATRSLIFNMATNSKQFGIRQDPNQPPNSVNESTLARPPGFTFQQWSQQNFVPRPSQAPQAAPPTCAKPSTEDLTNAIATNTLQFQQTTQASIKSLENQVEQLAASYNRLEAHLSNKFPTQLEMNPKENASAVTLRSGKQYDSPSPPMPSKLSSKPQVDCSVDEDVLPKPTNPIQPAPKPTFVTPPPFPSRLKKIKKEEVDKEILETCRKVEVNIPLLDAIKQVPRCAKFLKELCTNKKKLKGDEKISVGENVSAVLQKKLPPKCKDPGTFTIPCMIGNKRIECCMIDLGALINVMAYSSYASLNLGPLKETGVIVQLADCTNAYPLGLVEDVLVKVDGIVFLVMLNVVVDDENYGLY
ncbi:uncharacterized protein LOC133832769 [Humulus lupulus]|uniref:uncharacterized protein LOC133832769 n=1 Tax=Humulus lupulus TaxID=3486 RepID=UPI002B4058F9|nr:uncharacterized protein LOC133832769 [Humulus lupulus]